MPSPAPVLILGAGINGAAIARELVLNGQPVWLVDRADTCFGATAYSSRLIHGGLRYLEYGEFDLVRESLEERTRLLELAPQFVQPLRLFIPGRKRAGGLTAAALRFLKFRSAPSAERGQWLVRAGLWFYDRYARDKTLPRHRAMSVTDSGAPPVNREAYRWLCSYYDAQVTFPERFVQGLLADTRRLAAEQKIEFRLLTYHAARLEGETVLLQAIDARGATEASAANVASVPQGEVIQLQPAAIINATGAWVDETLARLPIDSRRLIGGTKGSHLFTFHEPLRQALQPGGIYTEAADGRPVFLLPLAGGVLVGTTDLPFSGDPADAVASSTELEYLLSCVNRVFPQVHITPSQIAWHYSGVRPLPYVDAQSTASITRRHWLQAHAGAAVPSWSVIGGKLTTCRNLAEETAAVVLKELGQAVRGNTRKLTLAGGEDYPREAAALESAQAALAERTGLTCEQVASLWRLWGTRAAEVAATCTGLGSVSLAGTALPRGVVRWCEEQESAITLSDLVERRLMLLYEPGFCQQTLNELAGELISTGQLAAANRSVAIQSTLARLHSHFGLELP